MIRSIFLWAFIVVNTLFWALILFLLSIFSSDSRKMHFYCAAPWARMIIWASGVKVEITGIENITQGKNYIYIPNHQSFFDIFSLMAYLPDDFKFVLKQELVSIPFIGWGTRKLGYISIDRSSPARARFTFKGALDILRDGKSLLVFAEGTRSVDGKLQPLKRGAFQLSQGSGIPVIPVAIKGSNRIMKKGGFKIYPGVIRIRVGQPVRTEDYKKKDIPDLVERVSVSLKHMLEQD